MTFLFSFHKKYRYYNIIVNELNNRGKTISSEIILIVKFDKTVYVYVTGLIVLNSIRILHFMVQRVKVKDNYSSSKSRLFEKWWDVSRSILMQRQTILPYLLIYPSGRNGINLTHSGREGINLTHFEVIRESHRSTCILIVCFVR